MPRGPDWETPDTMFSDPENPHLGGYILGGDPWSYYPAMWWWLLRAIPVRSVIDIGCGEGHALDWFLDNGCYAEGVDGVPQPDHMMIVQHDYTTGPYVPARRFDLAWCCEFVEHIEERYVPNFLATFKTADYVLLTHAVPGQGGHHHVNCQHADYWKQQLSTVGFAYSPSLTMATRALVPDGYYAWTGMAFVQRNVRPRP